MVVTCHHAVMQSPGGCLILNKMFKGVAKDISIPCVPRGIWWATVIYSTKSWIRWVLGLDSATLFLCSYIKLYNGQMHWDSKFSPHLKSSARMCASPVLIHSRMFFLPLFFHPCAFWACRRAVLNFFLKVREPLSCCRAVSVVMVTTKLW